MNVLVVSFGNINYDGRLRELINVAKNIGKVAVIFAGEEASEYAGMKKYAYIGKSYKEFIRFCIKVCEELEHIDILIVDNRRAVIPSLLIKRKLKIRYVVQDVRELYLFNEVKHFVGKVGCIIEKYLIKKSDLILCANKYRADIMKNYYKLQKTPIIFENYRMLEYSDEFCSSEYEEKYKDVFSNNKRKLISTSGCSVSRTNDELVKALLRCKSSVELFLVGDNNETDEKAIRKIITANKMENVHIIGRVKENELKFLIAQCDVGVVNYGMNDNNNIYCASGKVYEFLYEEKPVITTINPPLRALCDEYHVGVSAENYAEAIDNVIDNYDYYQCEVKKFIGKLSIEENNKVTAQKIISAYNAKMVNQN